MYRNYKLNELRIENVGVRSSPVRVDFKDKG